MGEGQKKVCSALRMIPLLQVQDLHVAYISGAGKESPALAGVGFDLRPGETLGVLGESGSGKSTMALALPRLLPGNAGIQNGVILFEGQTLLRGESRSPERIAGALIAVTFPAPCLALHLHMPLA